ncbi:hypothetical protein OF83DRAFT_1119640 [Amylostereum chailletii]|nr:hypothetical protein OF83DRAFT_1119640 [Amylostereum chailletii]
MDHSTQSAHCALDSCHALDFLPLTCFCEKRFCKLHIQPDSHNCPVDRSQLSTASGSTTTALQRCAFVSCKKPSLEGFVSSSSDAPHRVPALCTRCSLAFCAIHRDPPSHSCPIEAEAPFKRKNEEAHAILAKRFPPNSSAPKPKTKLPTDPKKLAQFQKIELMKIRHRAVPADVRDTASSVPLDERLFLRVRPTSSESNSEEKVFWTRKSIIAGRALDMFASHLRVSGLDASPLQLVKPNPTIPNEHVVLRNDLSLFEQVSDGSLLVVSRVPPPHSS